MKGSRQKPPKPRPRAASPRSGQRSCAAPPPPLMAAIEQISEGIAVVDLDGRVLDLNRAFAHMHGYQPAELRGKHISAFHTPEQMPAVNAANKQLLQAGVFTGEIWHARRDGTTFLGLMHNHVLYDAEGRPANFIGTLRDISALKLSEQAAAQSQRLLNEAEKIARLGSWEWHMLDGTETWSDGLYEITGYDPQKIKPSHENFIRLLHPDDRDCVLAAVQDSVSAGCPYQVEYRIIRPDQTQRFILAQGELHQNADGQPVKMVGTALDITERRRQDEVLLAIEARFRALAESSADAILINDQQGTITFWNRAAAAILGYEAHEALGQKTSMLMPAHLKKPHAKMLQAFLKTGDTLRGQKLFETTIIKKGGREIPVEMTISNWKTGGRHFFSFIIRDITERKQAEAMLYAREQELERQAHSLEETNMALKALLRNRDSAQTEQNEKVLANVKELIMPYLRKLEQSQLSSKQLALVGIIESCLQQIVSPFSHNLRSKYYDLTRMEIQIASMVRAGRTTSEIAQLLNSTERAVEFHRHNLRAKLGLKNNKANLRSFLLTLQE